MIGGNTAVGVMGQGGLTVRVDREDYEDYEDALREPGAGEMDFTGKTMNGFIVIDAEMLGEDEELGRWVDAGADYAASLPPKKK